MATARSLPYGAQIFLGQRYYAPTSDAWNPAALGPTRTTTPAPLPTVVPPYPTMGGNAPLGYGGAHMSNMSDKVYGTGGSDMSGSAWDWKTSPVIFILLAAVVSLLGLRYVHFRSGIKA